MPTSTAATGEAARLRTAMVDAWAPRGMLSERVEQAMRAVPRERFLPGVPLEDAYTDDIVTTHRDADGTVLSCTTMPSCVAGMLEQLDVRPGHRVLEIGAGTGINAALLAQLAGPSGHVTTIEILSDAADQARRHLADAGYENGRVICGDGALGYAQDAPYDRVIVTAGAWDIPPAWTRQATSDARMVIPLRISGFTHELTFQRNQLPDGPIWASVRSHLSGFIKMRGEGHHPERDVPVVPGGQSELRVEADLPADPAALASATSRPPVRRWTGTRVSDPRLPDLEIWLTRLGGLCRLINRRPGHGLAPATGEGGSLAVLDATGDTFAYLTYRPAESTGGDGTRELGIYAYGPDGDLLADRVTDRVRAWATQQPTLITSIEIYPFGAPVPSRTRYCSPSLRSTSRSSCVPHDRNNAVHVPALVLRPDIAGSSFPAALVKRHCPRRRPLPSHSPVSQASGRPVRRRGDGRCPRCAARGRSPPW
jgi:protein-L-isoaspartate(D-aspartate) O-methyltransferase